MGHLSHDDHVSQSHFSLSQGPVLRSWGYFLEQIKLQAKLLNYFLGSNKSNINQYSAVSRWVTFYVVVSPL